MAKVLWRSTLGAPSSTDTAYSEGPFEDSVNSTQMPLPVTLSQDIARSFRQLGVASFRASVVNVDSMSFQAAWTISESGEVTDNQFDRPLDSSFPAATAAINLLAHASDDETLLHKLSPRRWGIAWRLDDPNVVLAEAQFHERRDAISESDKTLLRLVCSAAMRPAGPSSIPGLVEPGAGMVWPGAEAQAAQPPRLVSRLSVVLLACSMLMCLWIAAMGLPELRRTTTLREAQLAKLQALADKTLVRGIGTAMSTGDYGDVQTVLSSYSSLGYFDGAAVVNVRQRVVALSGRTDQLRIGDPVPEETQRSAQAIELALGAERLGQLLIVPAPPTLQPASLPAWLQPMAWAAGLCAVAALVTALLAMRKPRAPKPL
ncbi:MAG TPA: hypothetical protein PK306_01200 [Aquabacterium sp.]|nr:hypothetical protein [Aquabacterium sp.]HQC94304.1 hypothetical protein [Aquabacterium sp.]